MSEIGMPVSAYKASYHILWTHVDGPYMTWAGQGYWLDIKDRFLVWINRLKLEDIAKREFHGYADWHR